MKKYIITSNQEGPRVMIMGGVHGNEQAGIAIIEEFKESLEIKRGEVVLVLANEKAVEEGVRYIEKNLNRCFIGGNDGDAYEDQIAREIMLEMDLCDGVLDIHSYQNHTGSPFVISEPEFFPIANMFDVDVISSGWTKVEPGGSDHYMTLQNKPAICIESGKDDEPESLNRARHVAMTFLSHFDMVDFPPSPERSHRYFEVTETVLQDGQPFVFAKQYTDFEELEVGEVFAQRGEKKFIAKEGQCIVFPHETGPVGSEAFILGRSL